MQERVKEDYVLKTACDDMVILIPLSEVWMILASDCEELQCKGKRRVTYQDREMIACSLAEVLGKNNSGENRYVVLLENEDMEVALFVEEVSEVIRTECIRYELPGYLPDEITRDILGCYGLEDQTIAYKIDIMNIVERLYASREEE